MTNTFRSFGLVALALAGAAAGCTSSTSDAIEHSSHAVSVSSASLTLQEQSNSCSSNQSQTFFKVTNTGSTPVKVSDITIKFWVYDTSGSNVVPQIYTGGCLLDTAGSCVHQVSGVTANATKFAPACGSDASHQANWEITISNTDPTALGAGLSWSGIQAALHLANWGSFAPGIGSWYTSCVSSSNYAPAARSAVYAQGKLVTASTGVPPACRAPHGTQQLTGHVPPSFDSSLVGPLPGTTQLTVGISLPLPDSAGLDTFIQQLYDPTSPHYLKFLSPSEFAAAYGPAQPDYDALVSFANANGLTVANTYENRSFVLLRGTAAAFESALFVTLNVYRRPDRTMYYAPANQPSLNLAVPLASITGLDNFAKLKHHNNGGGTGPVGCFDATRNSFAGADFRNVYLPGCSTDGAGQTVGLFEMGDYYDNDITDYNAAFSLTPTGTLTRVGLNPAPNVIPPLDTLSPTGICTGLPALFFTPFPTNCRASAALAYPSTTPATAFNASPYTNDGSEVEVALDIEMVVAMVPGANIRVYEANTGSPGVDALTILHAMASDSYVKSLSSSWAWGSFAPNPAIATVFQQFAAQGQSFFESSGDTGAYVPGAPEPAVWDPIISTHLMTVVGGTQLSTTGASTYAAETVWNDSAACTTAGCNSVSGGGLVSGYRVCIDTAGNWTYPTTAPAGACCGAGCTVCCSTTPYATVPIPSYQSGMPAYLRNSTALSTTTRMIPDVSLVAANLAIFADYVSNGATTYRVFSPLEQCSGGTSASAPLWAGIAAMVNQKLAAVGKPPIGFANPLLYTIASAAQATYSSDFRDVTTGNNHFSGNVTTPTSYVAATGYDLATGLGTPRCALVTEMVNRVAPSCYYEDWSTYASSTPLASVPNWSVSGGPSEPYVITDSGWGSQAVSFTGPAGFTADYAGKTFARPLDLTARFHFGSFSGLTFTLNAGATSPATTGYSVSVGDNPSPGVTPSKYLTISKIGGTAVASQTFDIGGSLTETDDNLQLSFTSTSLNVVLNGTPVGVLNDSEFASGKLEIGTGTLGGIVVGTIRVDTTGCTP